MTTRTVIEGLVGAGAAVGLGVDGAASNEDGGLASEAVEIARESRRLAARAEARA